MIFTIIIMIVQYCLCIPASTLIICGRPGRAMASEIIELYSSGNKFVIFCFALLLLQILDNYQNQGQFWNLLVLTISKHPLHVQFDQVLAEIFEVKDTWYHSVIVMLIDLTERKTIEIWRFCVKNNWLNILALLMVFLRIIVKLGSWSISNLNLITQKRTRADIII